MDRLDHQGSFVWVSISRITWINGSWIHVSKQIANRKSQAHRMKDLSVTLGFLLSLALLYNIRQIATHKSQAHRMKVLYLTLGFSYR